MASDAAKLKALRLAVCKGSASKVAQHLKTVTLATEPAGSSPSLLCEALTRGHLAIAATLLEAGATRWVLPPTRAECEGLGAAALLAAADAILNWHEEESARSSAASHSTRPAVDGPHSPAGGSPGGKSRPRPDVTASTKLSASRPYGPPDFVSGAAKNPNPDPADADACGFGALTRGSLVCFGRRVGVRLPLAAR